MKDKLLRKEIVLGIIVLFVGASVVPASTGVFNGNTQLLLEKQSSSFNDLLLDLKIKLLMFLGHMPSLSASIIKNDGVVWSKGYGFYNRCIIKKPTLWKEPNNDTLYVIGSISKTITATALLQLYENGFFNLSDDVNEFLGFRLRNPNYPDVPITFKMLLSHQSSLNENRVLKPENHIRFSCLFNILINSFPIPDSPDDWLKNLLDEENGSMYEPELWTEYPPGERANYSNLGFVILGYLVERISHQSIEQYVQENIFTPLNMMNTSFHPDDLNKSRMAIPCLKIAGVFIPLPHYDFFFASPAGGIRTTIDDLSRFLIAHMNNGSYNGVRILENDTVTLMHTPVSNGSSDFRFGLGWMIFNSSEGELIGGHNGGFFGCGAVMYHRESDNKGVIAFWNHHRPLSPRKLPKVIPYRDIIRLLFEKSKEF